MKRSISILFIFILMISVIASMSISAFAQEESVETETGNVAGEPNTEGEGAVEIPPELQGALGVLHKFELKDKIESLTNWFKSTVAEVWNFIQSDETYKNIFTAIVAVIAFLFLPVIIGVLVVAYLSAAMMTVFAGVLVEIVKVILTMFVGVIPM